ncbi:MAG: S9 family peptidase [Bacteroidales bacterium]|nr:S9 family peptidase [Bacteroidales bacterium]MBN2821493.1 S9 family peptidase [Bacteroidales bacterium]
MKKIYWIFAAAVLFFVSCDTEKTTNDSEEKIIGKPEITMKTDRLTPELLWSLGRVGEVALSPDKQTIVFGVKYYDISENKGNTDLYSMKVDGSNLKQITRSVLSEGNIAWRPDGKKIGFLYKDDSGVQLWEMNPDGTGRKKLSSIEGGITGFKYSPDQKKILYTKEVGKKDLVKNKYPDLPKANAYIAEELMFRHWDSWTESYSHIFIADYTGKDMQNSKDIMENENFDSPNKPFGGLEQVCWSPDSKSIIYTCVKKNGTEYAVSTNSDLYQYSVETGNTQNLTEGMMGYDKNPAFSPDGELLAWESMERDGYEADKNRLFIMNLKTGEKKDYSTGFDQNVNGLIWNDESSKIYFTSDWYARFQVYELDLASENIRAITEGNHNYNSVWYAGDKLIGTKMSMSMPTEIFSISLADNNETQLSQVNTDLLDKLKMGDVKERWVKTTDGKDMLVWVIYPPEFDANKKYPALLYCQGGPQSSVSQFFSYRWNFQIMAAKDYIIVAPNRRGLPSFGQEWNEQISGDWSGQNIQDYLSAIDEISKEPYVDETKLGAVGASYGGYSVFYLAGHHNKRFSAFIAHDGAFNLESMYLETEEIWFPNWEYKGPYWEKDNKITQRAYAQSPHNFVQNWDTPIMIIHGEKDYRIVYTQGMQAFTAAKLMGVPAKYLHFPEENHWILSPQNGILWQREFFGWLDKWLK